MENEFLRRDTRGSMGCSVNCVGIRPLVREMCRVARKARGTEIIWMDDGYIIGPSDVIFPA